MKGYRRVLVAVDFTPSPARVVEAGHDLAEAGGAVRLLHVVEWVPSVVEGSVGGYGSTRALRTMHADAERRLADLARGLAGVSVDVEVAEGQPSGVILDAVAEWGADAVVLGSRRRARFAGLRAGGVVERVLRGARVPVLVVPT